MQAEEFGKYIRRLRNRRGLTTRQLELYSGVSNSYISLLENGKRGIPSPNILKQLHRHLGVSYEEIMEKAGYISDTKITPEHPFKIPLIGKIPAGTPILAEEYIEEYITVPSFDSYRIDELFALRVDGDSMIGARIYPGDIVIVRAQQVVENGEIAVVNVDGENATLKRVRYIDGNMMLYSDNPKYPPITIKSEQARVCGKVVQVLFCPK